MRKTLFVVLLAVMTVGAKDKAKIQPAPLPSQVVTARSVFIVKGVGSTAHTVAGGYDMAFDSFYSEMKKWGRYEIVGSPAEADVVFEVTYAVENAGTRVWSSTNVNDGTTQVHSAQAINAQLSVVLYDAHTKSELWSSSVVPGMAFLRSNQQKEMISAGERLAKTVKQRVELSTPQSLPSSATPVSSR
jgi:hypothetical protein